MPSHYTLGAEYRFVKTDEDRGYLLGEGTSHIFTAPEIVALFSEMDRGFDPSRMDAIFPDKTQHPVIYYYLNEFANKGFIVRRVRGLQTHHHEDAPLTDTFADAFPLTSAGGYTVHVHTTVPQYRAHFEHHLETLGFRIAQDAEASRQQVHLIVCRNYLEPEVNARLETLRHTPAHCFLIRVSHHRLWFGPLLSPDSGPCGECLLHQLKRNRPVERYLERIGVDTPYRFHAPRVDNPTFTTALGLGTGALIHALSKPNDTSGQSIVVLNLSTLQTTRHEVQKRPQCHHCGDAALFEKRIHTPISLSSAPVVYDLEGGVRNADPYTTWNKYHHLIDPICGVVAHLGPYEGKNHPLRPVYYGTYFVNPPPSAVTDTERFTRNSYGKGMTPTQARVSALCEAVERYSAMCQGDEPIIRGTFDALQPEAVHPEALCNFSALQYADPSLATIDCSRQAVPPRYRNDAPIDWTPAWSLTKNRRRLLPATFCFTHYPSPKEEQVCPQNSNGHAAGNCLEEAILQGFFELVERDAAAIWWYNRLRCPRVSIESFGDTYFANILKHYGDLGWDLWCLNITTDLEIPVIVAVARHRQSKDYCVGMGCHLIGKLAVQRALTEIHQVFDPLGEQPPVWNESDIVDPQFLMPNHDLPPVDAGAFGEYRSGTLLFYIEHCLHTLDRAGLELIVQNQTRPDIGLPCVKTVVPGLRHMWRRLGPGRLYDVPVKMKWIAAPLAEDALNPKPLLL